MNNETSCCGAPKFKEMQAILALFCENCGHVKYVERPNVSSLGQVYISPSTPYINPYPYYGTGMGVTTSSGYGISPTYTVTGNWDTYSGNKNSPPSKDDEDDNGGEGNPAKV